MKTPPTLDRAAEQLTDGATETAELVADVLTDVAHSAVDVVADVVADGGDALAALSLGRFSRRLKQPRSLLAVLVLALVGMWLYRRYAGSDSDAEADEAEL